MAEGVAARNTRPRLLVQAIRWGVTLALSAIILDNGDGGAIARSVRLVDSLGIEGGQG